MTPDDVQRVLRVLKSVIDGQGGGRVSGGPDGGSSPVFDAVSGLLGKDWWRAFPVESLESVIERVNAGGGPGVPFVGDRLAREMQVLADRIKAERIAAEADDEWGKVSDDPSTALGDDTWHAGYARGYASGFRASGSIVTSTGVVFSLGDEVEKTGGGGDFRFRGQVVAVFRKGRGEGPYRVVVESTGTETGGMLHIFNPAQLRKR